MILTTIASVILVFARSVVGSTQQPPPNLFLSGTGLFTGALSILWTWGNGARLSRRLSSKPVTRTTAAHMLRRAVSVGLTLNCVGLLLHLLAAQQIIGSLAVKALTQSATTTRWGDAASALQPLDVLVVQANTNALLAQFTSLVSLLLVLKQVGKLEPGAGGEEEENDDAWSGRLGLGGSGKTRRN